MPSPPTQVNRQSWFEALKDHLDALYVVTDPFVNTNRIQINTLALGARLPTMHGEKAYVESGGLMSYGPNFPDLFRRAADLPTGFCAGRSRSTCRSRRQFERRQGAET
jgi:ABC-type uncharacterized transport system substrate-binding protein